MARSRRAMLRPSQSESHFSRFATRSQRACGGPCSKARQPSPAGNAPSHIHSRSACPLAPRRKARGKCGTCARASSRAAATRFASRAVTASMADIVSDGPGAEEGGEVVAGAGEAGGRVQQAGDQLGQEINGRRELALLREAQMTGLEARQLEAG